MKTDSPESDTLASEKHARTHVITFIQRDLLVFWSPPFFKRRRARWYWLLAMDSVWARTKECHILTVLVGTSRCIMCSQSSHRRVSGQKHLQCTIWLISQPVHQVCFLVSADHAGQLECDRFCIKYLHTSRNLNLPSGTLRAGNHAVYADTFINHGTTSWELEPSSKTFQSCSMRTGWLIVSTLLLVFWYIFTLRSRYSLQVATKRFNQRPCDLKQILADTAVFDDVVLDVWFIRRNLVISWYDLRVFCGYFGSWKLLSEPSFDSNYQIPSASYQSATNSKLNTSLIFNSNVTPRNMARLWNRQGDHWCGNSWHEGRKYTHITPVYWRLEKNKATPHHFLLLLQRNVTSVRSTADPTPPPDKGLTRWHFVASLLFRNLHGNVRSAREIVLSQCRFWRLLGNMPPCVQWGLMWTRN